MKNSLELVSTHFARGQVRYLIVGGWAVGAHGVARMTDDADVLISEEDYSAARSSLEKAGFVEWKRNNLVARFEHAAKKELQVVDLMFANASTFGKLYAESQEVVIEGLAHRIPSVNHLVAMKLHALKQGREGRKSKDVNDVIDLARVHGIDLKSDSFREVCMKFGGPSVYDYIMRLMNGP